MVRTALQWSVVCLALLVAPWSADAAQSVHLWLKVDGNDVPGDSTIASMDRANTIECWDFEHATARAPAGDPGGQTRSLPTIVIRKPIDKSSPHLLAAMTTDQRADGEFRFYRPDPAGSGAEQHFYTVAIEGGFVLSVTLRSLGPMLEGELAPPMYEEVVFSFESITYTYAGGWSFWTVAEEMRSARAASTWRASDVPGGPTARPTPRRLAPTQLRRR